MAGVVLGVAGTVYATNKEVRKNLPKAARDLPDNVRRRYNNAVSAAREASNSRREEILRNLEDHGGGNLAARGVRPDPSAEPPKPDSATEEVAATDSSPPAERQADTAE